MNIIMLAIYVKKLKEGNEKMTKGTGKEEEATL
jgi:hypothetical protein